MMMMKRKVVCHVFVSSKVAFGSGFKCNSAVWLCINNKRYSNQPPLPPRELTEEESKKEK
jgi:hypothetical protein